MRDSCSCCVFINNSRSSYWATDDAIEVCPKSSWIIDFDDLLLLLLRLEWRREAAEAVECSVGMTNRMKSRKGGGRPMNVHPVHKTARDCLHLLIPFWWEEEQQQQSNDVLHPSFVVLSTQQSDRNGDSRTLGDCNIYYTHCWERTFITGGA